MRALFLVASCLACCSAQAQVSNSYNHVYVGLGATSIFSVGYAKPINDHWGLRGELAMSPKLTYSDKVSNGSADISFKSNRLGLFADWFPFDNNLRLVGGLTLNDIQFDANAVGSGSSTITINKKSVNLGGENYKVSLTFPSVSPYIGVGLGHNPKNEKGLGFHADVGLMIGSISSSISTSLLTRAGTPITQQDIDAESKSLRDAASSVGVLPSLSVGLSYRF